MSSLPNNNSRKQPTKWWLRSVMLLAGVALVAIAHALLGSSTSKNGPASASSSAALSAGAHKEATAFAAKASHCADPSTAGAVHVTGNKVLTGAGKRFTFYGIAVFGGLEAGGTDAQWQSREAAAIAQIKAAPRWHANTLRLQIAEENLFYNGKPKDGVNYAFLSAVCSEVQLARREHMDVVVSDQTEWPDWTERNPTARSVKFWKVMGPEFANEPGIMFDLYNEPHLFYPKVKTSYHGAKPAINQDWVWKIWQRGGYAAKTHWVGMQSLVNDVRDMGIHNVVWVQAPYYDDTLGLASKYPIKGTNIVWSLHHPGMVSASNWDTNFGYLTRRHPVVDGEWSQYANDRPECRSNSYAMVPAYLAYLRAHHIGLMAWSLQPGVMLADPSHVQPSNTTDAGDSTNPKDLYPLLASRMDPNYACQDSFVGQGDGELVYKYFERYSAPLS